MKSWLYVWLLRLSDLSASLSEKPVEGAFFLFLGRFQRTADALGADDVPVAYTHLDVYKRQVGHCGGSGVYGRVGLSQAAGRN